LTQYAVVNSGFDDLQVILLGREQIEKEKGQAGEKFQLYFKIYKLGLK
jgi:hypothetical protein